MDCYLVLARCGMDDVPMRVFGGLKEAIDYALGLTREEVMNAAVRVLDLEVTHIITACVVPFVGGVAKECIRLPLDLDNDYEDEDYPDAGQEAQEGSVSA